MLINTSNPLWNVSMCVWVGNFMWQTYVDFFSGILILSGNN